MVAGSLEILMFSEIARLAKDMQEAKRVVGSAMSDIEKSVAQAKSVLGALGISLGVGYFVSLIKGSIDAMDHLHDLSKATSITVEELSGLKLAAKQSGGDLDSIAASINKLSQNMGKDAEKFKALGVSAKDPLEAFKQLSDIFVALQDPQQRAAVMAAALGKSWAGAAPLLAEGGKRIGEMVERGTQLSGVTKEMTDQADALNDKWAELVGTGGLLTRMVGPMLPLLTALADDMLKAREKSEGLTSSFSPMAETLRPLIVLAGNFAYVWRTVGIAISGVGAQIEAFRTGGVKAFLETRGIFKKILEDERAEFDAWEKRMMVAGTPGASPTAARPTGAGFDPSVAARAAAFLDDGKSAKKAEELKKLFLEVRALGASIDVLVLPVRGKNFEDTKEQLEKIKKTLEEGKKGWIAYADAVFSTADAENTANASGDSFTQTMEKLRETVREAVDPTYKLTKQFEALELAVSTGWITQADANFAKLDERIRSLLKPTENIHESIQQAWEKGLLSDDQMKKAVDQWNDVNLKMKDVDNTAKDMGHAIGTAFEDAVTGGKNFSDILKALEQDIARIILRMTVTKPLEKAIEGFDFGGLFGGLFGGGGAAPQATAEGGYRSAGQMLLVGEQGPELWRPNTSGTMIPNDALNAGGGPTVTINQTINIDSRSDRASIMQAMAQSKDMAKSEIMTSLNSGGEFAKSTGRR